MRIPFAGRPSKLQQVLEDFNFVLEGGDAGNAQAARETPGANCLYLAAFNKTSGLWALRRPALVLVAGSLGVGSAAESPWFEYGGHDRVYRDDPGSSKGSFCEWERARDPRTLPREDAQQRGTRFGGIIPKHFFLFFRLVSPCLPPRRLRQQRQRRTRS